MMEAEKRKQHRCTRCGHIWLSKLSNPVVCPNCHSYLWNRPYTRPHLVNELLEEGQRK